MLAGSTTGGMPGTVATPGTVVVGADVAVVEVSGTAVVEEATASTRSPPPPPHAAASRLDRATAARARRGRGPPPRPEGETDMTQFSRAGPTPAGAPDARC